MSTTLSQSVHGVAHLFALQLVSRLGTFLLNVLLWRLASSKISGDVAVLDLISATVLFLSRESIRMALLRSTRKPDFDPASPQALLEEERRVQRLVNMSWLPLVLGSMLSAGIWIYSRYRSVWPSEDDGSRATATWAYDLALALFLAAAVIELASEPVYNLISDRLLYRARVRVEGVGFVVRCITTLALFWLWRNTGDSGIGDRFGVLASGVAQFAFSLCLIVGFVGCYATVPELSKPKTPTSAHSLWPLTPKAVPGPNGGTDVALLDPKLFALSLTFFRQSFLKHLLTEGDRILLWAISNRNELGVYSFVGNYGSLVARILFQPIEETSRAFFSKSLSSVSGSDDPNIKASLEFLTNLIRAYIYLGLFFVVFGPSYSGALIHIIGGQKWSSTSAPSVMAAYCLYVPIMALNGITEAFFQGVADKNLIRQQSHWMVVFWVVFLASGYTTIELLQLGSTGMVVSNIINLLMRIVWSWRFIVKYFTSDIFRGEDSAKDEGIKTRLQFQSRLSIVQLLPLEPKVLLGFAFSAGVTFWSKTRFDWLTLRGKLTHVSIGAACAIAMLGLIFLSERQRIRSFRAMFSSLKRGRSE
ncbi:Rft protein-domain-containing protein [Polychytrium aggregatum]|uniref:Rft protein-domain-containing protein n=1 Tax=Polychytrium aggregatum TaxID=110093 RepID=UPI0022FDFA07|nr:Rft protein-domain-containing protein [Polychytrium aggregatum]KAI9197163.1 Rft protein-domain-containing protein [Polychytrium aggregatum]